MELSGARVTADMAADFAWNFIFGASGILIGAWTGNTLRLIWRREERKRRRRAR